MICDVGVWKRRLLGKVRGVGGDLTRRIQEHGRGRIGSEYGIDRAGVEG